MTLVSRIRNFRRSALLASISLLVGSSSLAAEVESPIDLADYARILESHTRSVEELVGVVVDYRAIAKDPSWPGLVRQVERAHPSRLGRDEQLAFWINAYNILTIDLVAKHYPLAGIKDLGSFFSPVWDREVATIEGRSLSLGQIEHDLLRPMGEPRIHSAIVCASISCPPLSRSPFHAERIDADLAAAMRRWLANPGKGARIDRTARTVTVSKIFDWFESDFEVTGGVLATIAAYVGEEDARWLRGEGRNASLRYFDYDWSLNDAKK